MKRFPHPRTTVFSLAALLLVTATAAAAQEPAPEAASPIVAEADQLLQEQQAAREQRVDLERRVAASSGEERLVLERQLLEHRLQAVAKLHALEENVLEQEAEGLDASAYREPLESEMTRVAPRILDHIDAVLANIRRLRAGGAELSAEDLATVEAEVADENAVLDERYALYLDHLERMQALGIDTATARTALVERLAERAEVLEGMLVIGLEQRAASEERIAEHPDDKEAAAAQLGAERKVEWAIASLTATVDQLETLEVEVSGYRQLLIETTGEVTADIFDRKVAFGLFERWVQGARESVVDHGPALFFKLVVFALILLVFRVLANFTGRLVRRAVTTSKLRFSKLLQDMFVSIGAKAVMIVGILVGLSQLGFQLGPILAGLGVAGFIVGFALQDTLSNFAAGAMILIYRPYKSRGKLREGSRLREEVGPSLSFPLDFVQTLLTGNRHGVRHLLQRRHPDGRADPRVDPRAAPQGAEGPRAHREAPQPRGLVGRLRRAPLGENRRLLGRPLGRDPRGEDALRRRGGLDPVPPARCARLPGERHRRGGLSRASAKQAASSGRLE